MTRTLIVILASLILVGCGGLQTITQSPVYIVAVENVYGVYERQKNPNSSRDSWNPYFTKETYEAKRISEIRKEVYQACFDSWENTYIGKFTNLGHGCIETRYTDEKNNFISTAILNRASFDISYAKKFNEFSAYLDSEENKRKSLVQQQKKEEQDRVKKNALASLELKYADQCKKFKKNSAEYENCLIEKQKLTIQEQNRIISMPPSERYAYTCEKTYGFRKGSEPFKDCVFKIMTTEHEMQTQINQRRIAELEARISGMERSASANNVYQGEMLEIERMKAKAMQDQVNFAKNKDITDTLLGISSNLLSNPSRPASNTPQMFNCQTRKFGGFDQIQCF
jgi:hypothetical protein